VVQQCSDEHHCHVTDDESYGATGDLITAVYDTAADDDGGDNAE